ncbi:hypothetical protein T440DRAFT_480396 [Plenodomus tracheiphilus IPT5]|uniref:Centromere protein X n=1 Tax=Plenodomus tracheiphilus IPT5 TaxID=1408161 RepID=A0A6A7B156_9PLEO|nr:hypothetical protein T440DRAFT_480396 [Plenodomus tracheiphilus IPT5]
MPPKNATAGASRRGGPQFKPPRPVKAPTQPSTTTKRAPAASKKTTAAPTSRAKPQSEPTEILSSGDEQDEFDEDIDIDSDDLMEDVPARPSTTTARPSAPPPISAPLLARLLYENFENEDTQIQKGAMNLVGKYVDIFVREAFARAKNEREAAVKGGGISDGFLQVEDLEKLAPQLVLDF